MSRSILALVLLSHAACADTPLEAVVRKYLAQSTSEEREEMAPELAPFDATTRRELTRALENVIAQPVGPGPVERRVMTNRGEVAYVLELPSDYDPSKAYPVLFWLMNSATHPEDGLLQWPTEKLGERYVVAAPAIPADDPEFAGYPRYETGDGAVEAILNDLGRAAHVDPSRVLVGGFSMGGALSWSAAVLQADRLAGAVPMSCNPPNNASPDVLRNARYVPLFVTHGALDQITDVALAREAVSLLKGYGFSCEFREVPGVGHVWPDDLEPEIVKWMEGKRRVLFPKEVEHHLLHWGRPMRRMYWVEATKGKYMVDGPGGKKVYASIRGKVEGNRIEVSTALIEKLTIYLNSDLVDFEREVVVVVNGKERHRGRVVPSLRVALEGFRERWDPEDVYSAKLLLEGLSDR